MIDIFVIAYRTVIIYFVLVLSMRISGKRQLGELQLSELITAFLISEVASSPITNTDKPLISALIPIAVLVSLEVAISYITTKSVPVKRLFEPSPTILIFNGKLNIDELSRQRLTADELISSLRLKDISDVGSVKYCFLEHNGQISAFRNDDILTLPVIVDGKIHKNHLKALGKDENWLNKCIKEQNVRLSDIFIGISDGTTFTVFAKNTKTK